MQYNTIHYSTVQYSAVSYSTVHYKTIQYNTINDLYCANIWQNYHSEMHYKSKLYNITSKNTFCAFVSKYPFNLFLKTAREETAFMLIDKALYSMGAAFWNHLSPAHFSDIRTTSNRCWPLHLNCMGTFLWDSNWVRYNGAISRRAVYIKHNTMNSICSCIGNQWSWRRTGVICSYHLVSVTIPIAIFRILCMHWNWHFAVMGSGNGTWVRVE